LFELSRTSLVLCLVTLAGNPRDWWSFLYTSSAGIVVWSSVYHSIFLSGYWDSVVKYHVDIVGIQW